MDKDNIDWTQLIPERSIKWENNPETQLIVIKKPKFKNRLLRKYLLPRLKNPDYSVKLDKIGTFVWQNIDGKTTFREIAVKMRKELGETAEPVEDRLGQFINSLRQYGFITFLNLDDVSQSKT